MPPQIVDDVISAVTAADTVIDSATALVNSIPTLIQDAVTKALAGGATAAQLAPFTDLISQVQAKSAALSAAVVANTPAAPPAPTPPPPPPSPAPPAPPAPARGR